MGKVINYAAEKSQRMVPIGLAQGLAGKNEENYLVGKIPTHARPCWAACRRFLFYVKPLVTTDNKYHSPEIIYIKNGFNGVITDDGRRGIRFRHNQFIS